MSNKPNNTNNYSLAYYSGDRITGSIAIVERKDGQTSVTQIKNESDSGLEKSLKPIFIGVAENNQVIILDPKKNKLTLQSSFPEDAFAAHIYSDPYSNRDWFMNDGDKESGNDTLNCGDKGSSVSVIEDASSTNARYLDTICVGRGHHQAAFTAPTETCPDVPCRAYISNLKDGTISAIGNDPADEDTYLKVVATINLCEPEKEEALEEKTVPNNAFPHGLVFSPLSGKLYNLNNGYGTIAIIDPVSNEIEGRIEFKGHSNLFIGTNGRYVIGRGVDRKSDPAHAIAKLTVLDVSSNTIVDSIDLPDVYISKYFFNPEGTKLYLTVSRSGSPEQQKNLKTDVLLIFDMTCLPTLALVKEVKVGSVGTLDFHSEDNKTQLVFLSNSEQGSIVVIDGVNDSIVETINVAASARHSRLWSLSR